MTSTKTSHAIFMVGVTMSHVIFKTDFTDQNIVNLRFKCN